MCSSAEQQLLCCTLSEARVPGMARRQALGGTLSLTSQGQPPRNRHCDRNSHAGAAKKQPDKWYHQMDVRPTVDATLRRLTITQVSPRVTPNGVRRPQVCGADALLRTRNMSIITEQPTANSVHIAQTKHIYHQLRLLKPFLVCLPARSSDCTPSQPCSGRSLPCCSLQHARTTPM